uniref:Uncharacterized protein n=1 Tax=Bartonella rochalimae ATCC BAA-1498 TaxID=685782 RepID=E6YM34_9HYPH|nr:hypothetical protein BARRO_50285 [Bartonella rochalimae ATCC BAA-1498]
MFLRFFYSYSALCGGLLSEALITDVAMDAMEPFHSNIHILHGYYCVTDTRKACKRLRNSRSTFM